MATNLAWAGATWPNTAVLFFEYTFLFVFLPVALAVYYSVPARARNAWLLVASCAFYALSSWAFLPILAASVVVDFIAGDRLSRATTPGRRRAWLGLSLATNLGLLGYFKYAHFITSGLREYAGMGSVPLIEAALPVGISFYTFQSMSYTIDIYRGSVRPTRRLVDFGAYVILFPQLIAGPIVRFSHLSEQLREREHSTDRFARGVHLFVIGLGKKLLVADTLAQVAEPLFAQTSPGWLQAWAAMFLYAGQIYFDFSGYSDMAIGLGRMFGFEFPVNFDSPYRAKSFADFWRRWHITLSMWLRDYLYIPLGGNRRGALRTYVNLALTMLLGGLWHGASWNFVLWGAVHGVLLASERVLRYRMPGGPPPVLLRRAFVFLCVTVAWVPFKHESFADTLHWLSAMFLPTRVGQLESVQLLAVLAAFALFWIPRNTAHWRVGFSARQSGFALAVFAMSLLVGYGRIASSPFLYFRF